MINVTFFKTNKIEASKLKFAVIAARYQDKWIFCRHNERNTWEIPGGHREGNESIEEIAHRELFEKTGALDAKLHSVSVYEVAQNGEKTYGMLFFAEVTKIGKLSKESEIAETKLFEVLPDNLTYPQIQPALYSQVQFWLNLQTNADELWDVYDENRNLTGKLHRRGDFMEDGEYHLSVHVWLLNHKGEFLLTKRSPNKGYPNMWESTGGSAIAGDDSLSAAMREVKEETGLTVDPACGTCVLSFQVDHAFNDVWLFRQDFSLEDVILLEGETCDKRYAAVSEILKLKEQGMLVPYTYLPQILEFALK